MKKLVFKGAGTALVTPMNSDNSVNYEKLCDLVETQIISGIDAIIISGTTGESATLSYDEKIKVVETAVKTADKRVPIIVGAGSNDTERTVLLSQNAADAGADALLLVTPFYNKTSQTGLVRHYNYIADRVHLPIILYNVPSRTGLNIKPETYKELSKHPNIVAAKEANGDISALAESISLCGEELNFYSGNDDQIVPFLSLGGCGVISVLSNILPAAVHKMCYDFFEGKVKESAAAQIKYTALIKALFSDVNPIPVKEAMNMLGYNVGPLRQPLCPMSDDLRLKLKNILDTTM